VSSGRHSRWCGHDDREVGVEWMLKSVMWTGNLDLSRIQMYSLEAKGYVGQDKRVLLGTQKIHLV
jgi:hypothetical protein